MATSHTRDKIEYVAFAEGKKYPIFVTQLHPERAQFLQSAQLNLPENDNSSIDISKNQK